MDSANITASSLSGSVFLPNSISFTKLKATSATVGVQQAAAKHFGGAYLSMPSGTSFWPGISTDSNAGTMGSFGGNVTVDAATDFDIANKGGIARYQGSTTVVDIIWVAVLHTVNTGTQQAFQTTEYLQASPPYDLGDGEVPLFIFLLLDASGHPRVSYVAPDPPWMGKQKQVLKTSRLLAEVLADPDGEHTPKQQTPTGTLPAKTKLEAYLEELDGNAEAVQGMKRLAARVVPGMPPEEMKELLTSLAELEASVWRPEPETQESKNRRMKDIPHPFIGNELKKNPIYGKLTPVMLDPMDKNTHRLLLLHQAGENVNALFHDKHIEIGNTHIEGRKGPPGVMIVSHKFKATRK